MSVLFVKPTRAYRLNSNDCAMQARSLAMTMSLVVVMRVVGGGCGWKSEKSG